MHTDSCPESERGPGHAWAGPLRVLLVDDSDVYRRVIAELVRSLGHEVVGEAADGVAAISAALELEPDIVIMDWQMPEMNGLSATVAIRDRWPAMEVIAHSVSVDEHVVRAFRHAGANSYVPKGDAAGLRAALQRRR